MSLKPFLKWAGGKRWLVESGSFQLPKYTGSYIEPFVGSGAVFFSHTPKAAILADLNPRLIETYIVVRDFPAELSREMELHHTRHQKDYYYKVRSAEFETPLLRAAQFLYLNRTCWNGLYRENLRGQFNVPIGTKTNVLLDGEDFHKTSEILRNADFVCSDFEPVIDGSKEGDLIFIDPPYTTAHNFNGFVKYNQRIFTWQDQIRLRDAVQRAADRLVKVVITNADHESIRELYSGFGIHEPLYRSSVISGKPSGRQRTSELIIRWNP
ncbi:DNA adenine methylase [Brucella anthropi]|uniref:DNA adenine methylase n=1 Tax=Brucella anthropi TaxID=529 RepID=UPI003EE0C84A